MSDKLHFSREYILPTFINLRKIINLFYFIYWYVKSILLTNALASIDEAFQTIIFRA